MADQEPAGTQFTSAAGPGRDTAGCVIASQRFPRRLTELGVRVFTLGLVLGLLASLTGSRVLLAAGAFAGLLPLASMLTVSGQRIRVTVEGAGRARVGSSSSLRIWFRNEGRNTSSTLELRCVRPLFAAEPGTIGPLPPRGTAAWELNAAPVRRGVSTHLHVEMTRTDLFGLGLHRVVVLLPLHLAVGPRAVPVPATLDRLLSGTTLDPGDLRSWRAGDSPSAVAWRASARRCTGSSSTGPSSSLVVRERAPTEPDIVRLGVAGGSAETAERVLEVLAAAALALMERGRQLEVRIGEQVLRPARAEVLLDALAGLPGVAALPEGPHDLVVVGRGGTAPGGRIRWVVDSSGRVDVS